MPRTERSILYASMQARTIKASPVLGTCHQSHDSSAAPPIRGAVGQHIRGKRSIIEGKWG